MDLKIECPKCGARIDVSRQIADLVTERSKDEVARLLAEERKKLAVQTAEQVRKAAEDAANKARREEHLKTQKVEAQLGTQQKENERLRKQQDEKVAARAQELVRQEGHKIRSEVAKSYVEKLGKKDLAIAELQKKQRETNAKLEEAQAKLATGSPQTQGVLAEEDLYSFLRKQMPSDRCHVEKRGQGKKGTDVIIHVKRAGQQVGAIIVDDKWAGDWNSNWPEKVWNDMQQHGADFAYIAANPSALSAMPEDVKAAGFGVAPCRRAGVRVWVVDRCNLHLVVAVLTDTVDKLLKLAEVKAIYGVSSKAVQEFQEYLSRSYETDLREKAKHMSAAVKALNEIHKKVDSEYEKALDALKSYWKAEERVHRGIACFGQQIVKTLPQIEFAKER